MATEDSTALDPEPQASEHRTQFQQFWREFRKNNLSIVGAIIIGLAIMTAVFAPVIAPHHPATQYDAPEGEHNPMPPGATVLVEDTEGQETVTVMLGTDNHGRDLLSRMIFGLRTLMVVAFGVNIVAMAAGVTLGAVAGYLGDTWVDEVIMRAMDIILSFPSLILAIAIVGILGAGKTDYGWIVVPNLAKIIFVIGFAYVPRFARVMRSAVLREMEEDYVDAAKSIGASNSHILVRDILVNTIPIVVVQASLYMATAVLASAGLSFLGLGLQPPTASLGLMLSNARSFVYSGQWWYPVFPGITLMIIILGFNLLGDGLRDALDPRYTEEGGE
ncbi:ABC transporter permease [Halorarius litoreus]|uniref:ABC transporter permease n=1 Tax=Halorarius litoreus TaxID=2962676 RepID=UPI0020CC11D5|nr:ABC transporter permease [Halorarius litoreus]